MRMEICPVTKKIKYRTLISANRDKEKGMRVKRCSACNGWHLVDK